MRLQYEKGAGSKLYQDQGIPESPALQTEPAMLGGGAHLMSALKVPRVESYLSRWDACFTPPVPNRCMFNM